MISTSECWLKNNCKKANNCGDFCIKLYKLNELYNLALISNTQRKHVNLRIDEDGTDRDAFTALKDIDKDIENFISRGQNLYIHSTNPGNGKSSWSLRLVQSYFDRIWHKSDTTCRALFIHVPRYLLALKDSLSVKSDYVDYIKKNIFEADIVIFDEIGTKVATQFEFENLLSLINTRIDLGKSNVYTSNMTDEEFKEKLGDRLYSRIVNLSTNIELFGQDKRGIQ